ncbi:MAG: chromosomal replication initiator protein DnaA [Clostridiales bacterium]|nr:chromosomal replication initiator protein DnaA [Clostridiales bacterium]
MDSFAETWPLICDYCKSKLVEVAYETWIKRVAPYKIDVYDKTAYFIAPNQFHRDILERSYSEVLTDAVRNLFGEGFKIHFYIPDEIEKETKTVPENTTSDYKQNIYEEFTFENYIVGPSNKFAHAASMAVAQNPAGAYNPLFIYGSSGLGKTHLMYAIGNEIKKNNPNMRVTYVKGEVFANELIESLWKNKMPEFRQRYRESDVLLVDDVHFIAGKDSTQEEFFHTFNTLYESDKQIVLTSDRPPREIKTLEERIRNRFESGLLADVQAPNIETRIAIIKNKAQSIGLEISDDMCEYIANKLKTNIRQLEGAVKKIGAKCVLSGERMSINLANEAIRDVITDPDMPKPQTVERIIDEVVRNYGFTAEDIRSINNKKADLSHARQIAIYLVREITHLSVSKIGEEFGGRNYSTIIYSIKQIEKEMNTNSNLKVMIEEMIKNIKGS